MTRYYAAGAALLVAAMLGTLGWLAVAQRSDDAFAGCRTGQVAGGADTIGGPFTLVDETGAVVTDAQVITRPSLVYFGYTFCPDVCPLDSARNAQANDMLAKRGFDVQTVMISIDPERDTPQVLAEFTEALHPAMIGLTGSAEQVKAASEAYRTYYKAQPAEDGYYLMDHSTFTYLVLPETGFAEFFRRDVTPEQMADRVACFLDAS